MRYSLIASLPSLKLKGLVVSLDAFSRSAEVKAVPPFTGREIVRFLDETSARFGPPNVLRCDRGLESNNTDVRSWCDQRGTKQQFSSVANPRNQDAV